MDLNNLTFDTSKCFINGAWVEPENGKMLDLLNPSNGEFLCKIARGTIKDINKAVYAAQESVWKKYTALERGRALLNICLLYTSPSPRDRQKSRMPSSA